MGIRIKYGDVGEKAREIKREKEKRMNEFACIRDIDKGKIRRDREKD